MTDATSLEADPAARLARLRQQVDDMRQAVRKRLDQHGTGIQAAAGLAQATETFVIDRWKDAVVERTRDQESLLQQQTAIVAVGGSGRGDVSPYSDVDLLFLHTTEVSQAFENCVAQVVRDCWDAGLKLGHSVRTPQDALRTAKLDPQFATTLVSARCLWGSKELVEQTLRQYQSRVLRGRRQIFIAASIDERDKERITHGATVQQLEPDVKRSLGGLRDLHLIQWIGAARYGTSEINSLKLLGALSPDDALRLTMAHEYITSVRHRLHLAAGKPQDVLTRDDQLRIAEQRGIPGTAGQRPVERFMQEYFQHSMAIAEIAARFVEQHRQQPVAMRIVNFVMSHRVDDIYRVGPEFIDIPRRFRARHCSSLEDILRLYVAAGWHRVKLTPNLTEHVKSTAKTLVEQPLSAEASRLFLEFLSRPGRLGLLIRSLHETGVLDLVLPAWSHIRCLLQFNQYHSYTVDEHTLRTIEAAEGFLTDNSPLGQAYREIPHKELLHLALLLHDAGKGYEEDHSEVGRRLAWDATQRLGLPEHQRDLLVFLVHRHLLMATLAFRRDTTDPEVLLNFNYEVGSPDALRMLFVLTAADISAVGPGVWNDWKAELLAGFYDRCMIWLSGKSYLFEEPARLQRTFADVQKHLNLTPNDADLGRKWLESLPTHYLLATPPARIAADYVITQRITQSEIEIESQYDAETRTVEYRVIVPESASVGCFHKLTGVLSAKRMEILSAQICTSTEGLVIDSYRVRDYDHEGEVPEFRQQEVARLIRQVLRGELDVDKLFQSRSRFSPNAVQGPLSNLPMRVVIDNETSDKYTILDVFAHDRPGLLYRIARTLFEWQMSVTLAKISTHFDQVVDVFYITDSQGRKLSDSDRLKQLRDGLAQQISRFEAASATGE